MIITHQWFVPKVYIYIYIYTDICDLLNWPRQFQLPRFPLVASSPQISTFHSVETVTLSSVFCWRCQKIHTLWSACSFVAGVWCRLAAVSIFFMDGSHGRMVSTLATAVVGGEKLDSEIMCSKPRSISWSNSRIIDPITNPIMHLFYIPQCTIQNRNGALWDMEQVCFGICEIGLLTNHCQCRTLLR